MAKRNKKAKRARILYIIFALFLALIVLLTGVAYLAKQYLSKPMTKDSISLYIKPGMTVDSLVSQLKSVVDEKDINRFENLLRLKKLNLTDAVGHYKIDNSTSIVDLYRRLAGHMQTPVRLTFNNLRTIDQLAERLGEQLLMGADTLKSILNDGKKCDELGFTTATVPAMFLPDTYEVYWTISPDDLVRRMKKEYDLFWTDERVEKAGEAGLTPVEVIILASIVEEETNVTDEKDEVAGLYLNRLRRGMPLQADPTIKFALQNFELKRILKDYLQVESPYNTYKYTGLPPGPIRMPSKNSINAVLNYSKHDYIFMCAKEDFSGRHNFAKTIDEHNRNAARYHRALSNRNIFR